MVFVKRHVFDPMQSILDAPMPANDAMKLLGISSDTANVGLPLVKRFSISIAVSLHHNRALDTCPLMPKSGHAIKHADFPCRAPSMSLFLFLIATQGVLRLRLLGNASVQSLLIGFDTDQIVIALLNKLVQCFFDSVMRPT